MRRMAWPVVFALLTCLCAEAEGRRTFQAGAAAVDISPRKLPAIVSGSFLERTADAVRDPLYARAFAFDDGTSRCVICIVDTLFMPRELIDQAKSLAAGLTDVQEENVLVSATHTHTAPSVAGALGTGTDEEYRRFLPPRIAEAIRLAVERLEPAAIGWTVVDAPDHTHCRRWILRPDRIRNDVFGQRTVRANMHPGYQHPDFIGPAGPADTWLSLLSVKSTAGRPLAVLANYSMHYFGSSQISADYMGRFVEKLTHKIGVNAVDSGFVAAMSQGTSGDLHWMDYGKPRSQTTLESYSEELAGIAARACKTIQHRDWVPLTMLEKKLTLRRRVPAQERLEWARKVVEGMQGRKPGNRPEVYAWEQLHISREPVRELKLQVLRLGELGITAIPCEVYGLTGVKIKAHSPLQPTFNLELANGSEGYIPPPEQHVLGGYTTWAARSAALERDAEPRIVEAILTMLEEVSGQPRLEPQKGRSSYDRAVLASKPMAYWRMGEFQGPGAVDSSGQGFRGTYEDGVVFRLPGPDRAGLQVNQQVCPSAQFAGGRMVARLPGLKDRYSISLWVWNGMPADAREFTGFFFSRDSGGGDAVGADCLGIGGTARDSKGMGKLVFSPGAPPGTLLVGKTEIRLRTWSHVVLVRDRERVTVYLNGNPEPEISAEAAGVRPKGPQKVLLGGRQDARHTLEGRLCNVALYDRVLTDDEIAGQYRAAGLP